MKTIRYPSILQPFVGARTVKTIIAVAITAYFMKYVLHDTPFFGCIGAVVAMERTFSSSLKISIIRNFGTLTGGLMGIAVSSFTSHLFLLSLGLAPMFYINNKFGRYESNVPGAIVYLAVVYLNTTDQAWTYGLHRIVGTFIGSLIGMAVNAFLFPPEDWRQSAENQGAGIKA